MKKIDILNLIKAKKTIEKNQDLLSTIQDMIFSYTNYKPEEFWFPNIPELKEYFDILKIELLTAKKETEEAEAIINKSGCEHEVRLSYHHLFSSSNICVLCGHNVSSDNTISFKESNYRNKHTVTFSSKYQENEDGPYEIANGKTFEEVLTIINDILANFNDDDEVDLVEEFAKLNIKDATINQEKRKSENYILIIGGSNREYLNQDTYLANDRHLNSTNFITYFSEVLNCKIAIIENKDILNNPQIKNVSKEHDKILFQEYSTLYTFQNAFHQVENIPFKLIIDLSELYDYQIQGEKVIATPHELNLQGIFPNSHIIRIHFLKDSTKEKEISVSNIKRNEILQTSGYNQQYYYLKDEDVQKKDLDETCHHLKMLLRK